VITLGIRERGQSNRGWPGRIIVCYVYLPSMGPDVPLVVLLQTTALRIVFDDVSAHSGHIVYYQKAFLSH